MSKFIGLDIGGTKIAGGAYCAEGGLKISESTRTPTNYDEFIRACVGIVTEIEQKIGESCTVGAGLPGILDEWMGTVKAANLPFLADRPFRDDLSKALNREVRIANDANCMALAEAVDGAGTGYDSVLGLILGTGVGSGYICNGKIIGGINGMTGEIGHIPMPYIYESGIDLIKCGCGQTGCIETVLSGPGFARLYKQTTGLQAEPQEICELAKAGDNGALKTLDLYFDMFAKAMVCVFYSFDPAVIVVSGGMNDLPGFYDRVPHIWGKYSVVKKPKTKIVKAVHGALAGMRGAAWLWRTVQPLHAVSRQVSVSLLNS